MSLLDPAHGKRRDFVRNKVVRVRGMLRSARRRLLGNVGTAGPAAMAEPPGGSPAAWEPTPSEQAEELVRSIRE
jgi:hypothetical protein